MILKIKIILWLRIKRGIVLYRRKQSVFAELYRLYKHF